MSDGAVRTGDGAELSYTAHGGLDGPTVVLAHPLGLDRTVWDGVADILSADMGVVAYDLRGHGRSGGDGPFTVGQAVDDLLAVVDGLGLRKAVVVGCSLGGCVAQAFAAAHPRRAVGLGLVDTTAWYGDDGAATWAARAGLAREKGLGALVDGQVGRWFSDAFVAARPGLVAAMRATFLATKAESFAAACEMLGGLDLRGALNAYTAPAAVIVGSDDLATTPAMAEALAAELSGARLTVLPGARHLTPVEAPEAVAAALVSLMGEVERRPS